MTNTSKERVKAFCVSAIDLLASTDNWDEEDFELLEAFFETHPRWEDLWNALTCLEDDD